MAKKSSSSTRDAQAAAVAKAAPTMPEPLPAASLESLDVALRMLAGFQHRHKNQHRLSTYWWSPFQQLRRHAAKLRTELQPSTKTRKSHKSHKSQKGDEEEAAVARARWMLAHDVPKAYLAFSRLVVDKQFAQLGVLLLGILAQIRAVLVQVIGPDEVDEPATVDEDDTTDKMMHGEEVQPSIERAGLDSENDWGEAVAREAEIPDSPTPIQEKPTQTEQKPEKDKEKAENTEKKERKEGKDKVKKDRDKKDRKEKDKKDKKNKKRKRGDEFDDLFNGLL